MRLLLFFSRPVLSSFCFDDDDDDDDDDVEDDDEDEDETANDAVGVPSLGGLAH